MLEILKELRNLSAIISTKDMVVLAGLMGLMLLASFLEALGIAAVPAFITMIVQPSALSKAPLIGHWFVELPSTPSKELVILAGSVFILFIFLKNAFLTFLIYVQASIVASQRLKLSDRLFSAYQHAPYVWHLTRGSPELTRNLQHDVAKVFSGFITPLFTLMMSALMALSVVLVMTLSTPAPTLLAVLIVATGMLLIIRLLQGRLSLIGASNREAVSTMLQAIQNGLGGLIEAKIGGKEFYFRNSHKKALAQISKAECQAVVIQKVTPLAVETIAILGLVVVITLMISTEVTLVNTLPLIGLLGASTIRLKQLASQIAGSINTMNLALPSVPIVVSHIVELEEIEMNRAGADISGLDVGSFVEVRLHDVSFSYPNMDRNAISEISLSIRSGESVAFVGPTGGGKSTLINLILGLLEPARGRLEVNGVDISRASNQWREMIGYIPQSIYLADASIRSNIAFGVSDAEIDESRLDSALRSASLADFVASLPDGINTYVGERGVRLSGGQRQRLGIARALYTNPEVLVMDEASSSLDNETEREVMLAIHNMKRDRTLIMIAHRLSTVRDCDRLYYVNNGRIEHAGSYRSLQEDSEEFRKMAASVQ